jgi:iron complex outermembrane recepter protein
LQAAWQHSGGTVTASAYYESLRNWITLYDQARVNMVPGVMNTVAKSYTNVDARLWGGELEATQTLGDRVFLSSSVTWTRGEKNTDPARKVFSQNMAEMPPLTGRLALRYDSGRLYAETEGVFAAAQDRVDTDLQEKPTAGWGILNLKLGTTLAGFRVQATLANVFNREYQEYLSSVRDPFRAGVYIKEPGRSLSVAVSRQF